MEKVKTFTIVSLITLISFTLGWFFKSYFPAFLKHKSLSTITISKLKPLEQYTIENLSKTNIRAGKISITDTLSEENDFTSYLFSFEFNPDLDNKTIKKTTGLLNIPKGDGPFPIIVMIRGFVDQKTYTTGTGTIRAGEYFVKNGFITIAPDFLGYAGSDIEAGNIFESRFQTYTTILSLLKYLEENKNIENINKKWKLENGSWKFTDIGIWGHSNGGQIALTILEITKGNYPTVLWAPVSKPFPYSILYYTDESEDKGKFIRSNLALFEQDYNVEKYSLDNYLSNIISPIQIHQGTSDDAVPYMWSKTLYNNLLKSYKDRDIKSDLNLFLYTGSDHNLQPNWDLTISRSLIFFQKHLTK